MKKKALRKPNTNNQPSQAFRSTALEEPAYIPTRLDHTEKTERHVILWEDIQQAFKGAQHIMNGSTMVPFVIDMHLKRVVPWRIQYQRDAVLDVILDNPGVAQGSGMNSRSPQLSAYPESYIRAKNERQSPMAPSADNEKSIQVGDQTCLNMQKSQDVPHGSSPNADRKQSSEVDAKLSPALNASDQALEIDTDDDTCSLPELEMLTVADTVLTETLSSAITSSKPTATPLVQDNEDLPEQHHLEKEYEAMLYMTLILESSCCNANDFAAGDTIRALSILSHSNSIDFRRMAAEACLEIAKAKEHVVTPETLRPLLLLLQSDDTSILRDALGTVLSVTRNDSSNRNKLLIAKLGGLKHIIRSLSSADSEILLNATGCMINLAIIEKNREIMMISGSIPPLIRLAQKSELEVQRKAVKALSNLAASRNKKELGKTHAVATLISLLDCPDPELQSLAAGAISNVASHDDGNDIFPKSATGLIRTLIRLLNSVHEEARRNAAMALGKIAKSGAHAEAIVREGSLGPLLRILQSDQDSDIQAGLNCLVQVLAAPSNKVAVVKAGFIERLANLIDSSEDKSILETSAGVLYLLAMDGDQNTLLSLHNGGVIERILAQARNDPSLSQVKLICILPLIAVMNYYKKCDKKNVLYTMVALLDSPDTEVLYMSAMIIHDLSEQKQSSPPYIPLTTSAVDAANMRPFMDVWDTPFDGLHSKTCLRDALIRILKGTNVELQQLAIETICELLEGRSIEMIRIITHCSPIVSAVAHLAKVPVTARPKKHAVKKHAAKKSDVAAKNQENEKIELAIKASMLLDIIRFFKEEIAQVQ